MVVNSSEVADVRMELDEHQGLVVRSKVRFRLRFQRSDVKLLVWLARMKLQSCTVVIAMCGSV